MGTHTDAKPTFHAMHRSRASDRAPWCGLTLKTSSAVRACASSSSSPSPPTSIHPSIDRSIGMISFRFYASRSSIGSRLARTSCVHRATRKGGRIRRRRRGERRESDRENRGGFGFFGTVYP